MILLSVIDLIPVIDLLREEQFVVTICDRGNNEEAKFCLAVKIDDPVDLYYLGRKLSMFPLGVPYYKANLAYFPEVEINAELYEYICVAD